MNHNAKLRWPIVAIILALLGLWITWDHPHLIDKAMGFTVLSLGIAGTVWGLVEKWPL